MRKRILTTLVRWLAVILILRVLGVIVSNYADYFPPNFDSLFLQGRVATFHGAYRVAFYLHIFAGPIVLLNGLVLLIHQGRLHRWLGRVQAGVVLFILTPTSTVMAIRAFGGWPAGLSFLLLTAATAACTAIGVAQAIRRSLRSHRRWMLRSYVLICSAVVLRLASGTAGLLGVENAEDAYIAAAWCSWLVPLTVLELMQRKRVCL